MIDADMEAIGIPCRGDGRRILSEKFGEWHQWSDSVSKFLHAEAGAAMGD